MRTSTVKIMAIFLLCAGLCGCGAGLPSAFVAEPTASPGTPTTVANDQVPIGRGAEGSFARQTLSFLSTDDQTAPAVPQQFYGLSN
jgi:hypothetical protein